MSHWEYLNTTFLELLSILLLHHGVQRRVLISTPASPTKDTELPVSPYLKTGIALSLISNVWGQASEFIVYFVSILTSLAWDTFKLPRHNPRVCFFHLWSEGCSAFLWQFLLSECPLAPLAKGPKPPSKRNIF